MDIFNRNHQSILGRLNVRVKLAAGFGMSIVAVMVDSLSLLVCLAAIGGVFFLCSRPNGIQFRLVGVLSLLLVWGSMFSQAIFYNQFPRDVLFTIAKPNMVFSEGVHVYVQGIHYGATQSFRMIAVLLMGYAICFSTEDDQFLRGFVALKVPFGISFMAVSAIQFAPVAVNEYRQVRIAMGLKGYRPFGIGVRHTLHTELGALRSVLASTIRRSEEKAISILTRGFDLHGGRSYLHEDVLSIKEKVMLVSACTVVFFIVGTKMLFWSYQYQLFYSPELRSLYGFARDWL